MASDEFEAVDVEIDEDPPYCFQRIGELALEGARDGHVAFKSAKYRQRECIATAPHHGVAVIAGNEAVYLAKIDELISFSEKKDDEEAVAVASASEICVACITASQASVHISSDGTLLAVCEDTRIRAWAIADLLNGNQDKLLSEWLLGQGEAVKQFFWQPGQAATEPAEVAVVTDTGRLLHANLGSQLKSIHSRSSQKISCAAYSPDGSLLAFATGNAMRVAAVDSAASFKAIAKLPEAEDDDLVVLIDTMAWAGPDALVLACSLYNNEDSDVEESCSVCMLHWTSWQPESSQKPTGLELVRMAEVNTDPDGQPGGHYHQSLISPWGVAVAAHGKANDNHIIVLEAMPAQPPKLLEILDDALAIRIPLAADYADNFVTGLGAMLTGSEEVYHPDPEKGKLPPQPILLVATSDDALRLFSFASLKRSADGITHAALPYSEASYPMVAQAASQQASSAGNAAIDRTHLKPQPAASGTLPAESSTGEIEHSLTDSVQQRTSLLGSRYSEEVGTYDSKFTSSNHEDAPEFSVLREASDMAVESAALTENKAAATQLPDSDDEFEEDSQGSSIQESSEISSRAGGRMGMPAQPPPMQPELKSTAHPPGKDVTTPVADSSKEGTRAGFIPAPPESAAEAASKAAATASHDRDNKAVGEDLEAQAMPANASARQPQLENAAQTARRAAAAPLPDSADETDEDHEDLDSQALPAEAPSRQPKLESPAEAAAKEAAALSPDNDDATDDDLESQASVSISPLVPAQARTSERGFLRANRAAETSQAAESAAPRRLGTLDSLSTSDTESIEVQSRPETVRQLARQPPKEEKPAASPWLNSFGNSTVASGQVTGPSSEGAATVTPSAYGNSATAFGQDTGPSSTNTAAPTPSVLGSNPTALGQVGGSGSSNAASVTPSLFGKSTTAFAQAVGTTKAAAATFGMVRQRSGTLGAGVFAQPLTAPAQQPSDFLPPFPSATPRPVQAPQVPRQSAAQQAIARAREEAAKAAKLGAVTPAPSLSVKPSDTVPKASTPSPAQPPPPKARLQDEGKELSSMEREFLKSLAETRAIEAKLTAEIRAAEGIDPSDPGTRKGALALQGQVEGLTDRVGALRDQLASDRGQFSALHTGWKEDRARAEALLFFNGKRDFLDEDEAVYASEDVNPAIQELVDSVQEQLPLLEKQADQLSDGIGALKTRGKQGPRDGPMAMQQLYNALNLQKEVALSQVTRVQKLWDKMQDVGIADPEASTFDSLQQLQLQSNSIEQTKSSRSPYVRLSRSPWSQSKGGRSPLLLPGNGAVASKSPWAGDSAAAMRALLLEKVASQDGSIRYTRLEQPYTSDRAAAPGTKENSTSQARDRIPTLSSLQLRHDSGRLRSGANDESQQPDKESCPSYHASKVQPSPGASHRWPNLLPERSNTPAQPQHFIPTPSAETSSESEGHSISSPALHAPAQMARPPKQFESLIQPSVVAQSKPSPALQWTTAPSASRKAPDTPERPADTQPSSTQKLQPTAKMPPIPSKAALAAAQARSAAVWSKANQAAPASQDAASMPVKAAAKPKPDAAPKPKAATMPPIPSRAALAAAQAQGQATLSGQKAKPGAAKMPPVPSKAALASAEAKGRAALASNTKKPAKEASSGPQMTFPLAGLGAASSSAQAKPLSFGLAPSFSPAPSQFGAVSSAAAATPSLFSAASLAPIAVPPLFGAASPGAPASLQLASSIAAPQPVSATGAFNFSNAPAATSAAATPVPMASVMSMQNLAALPPSAQTTTLAFPGLSAGSTSQAASSSVAASTPLFGVSAASQPAESLAAGFGAFGGLGQQASAAPNAAASPFGKGLSFGLSAAPAASTSSALAFGVAPSAASAAPGASFGGASPPAAPFAAFGQPSAASAAAPSTFGGFGQGASTPASRQSLFGQSASPAVSAPSPFGGFGAPTGFGQSAVQSAPSQGLSGFGQAATISPGFGAPATPGFGQSATPAFAASATPGFGSPGTPAFGAPASPAAPFGAPASANAFGGGFAAAASQTGGFGSLAQALPNAFGAAAQQSSGGFGGFGGAQQQSGGFGAFGGAPAPSPPKIPSPQAGGSMWAPRK